MGERGFDTTAEGVTPVTAQAKELLAQANLESVGIPTTEGAGEISVVIPVQTGIRNLETLDSGSGRK